MTTQHAEVEPGRRPLLGSAAIFVPLIVVGMASAGYLIAGSIGLVAGPSWPTRVSAVVVLALGACGVFAASGWVEGRPASRWIALVLLPLTALLELWDDWRWGGTSSVAWGVGPLLVAWLLLFLPVVRRYFARP